MSRRVTNAEEKAAKQAADALGASEEPTWPVTVCMTRYGGAYEGGAWAAFGQEADEIDDEAFGSDLDAGSFWSDDARSGRVGRGATPEEAVQDMIRRRLESGESRSCVLRRRW